MSARDTERVRGHEVVLRRVEAELMAGRLQVGGRLPSERAFAEELGISRPSVREGIRVLEAMGTIRTAVGSGPESGAIVIADTAVGITSALRMHVASQSLPVRDLVATRVLLESWVVAQAATHEDSAALAEADALLIRMNDLTMGAAQFLRLDAEFHIRLAQASENEVVAAIMTSLRHSIEDYVLAGVAALPDWNATARRLRRQHRAILRAIQAGDGGRASVLVGRHIRGYHSAANLQVSNSGP